MDTASSAATINPLINAPSKLVLNLNVTARESQKRRPVRPGRVPAAVLAEGNIPLNQRCFHGWKFGRPQVLLAQQTIHRPRIDGAQEHPLGINPTALHLLRAAADKYGARRAQRN